jgi:ribosomal protein L7/L12
MEVDWPTYTLWLIAPGDNRLGLMKALRALRSELDPKAAKALMGDQTPLILMNEVGYFDVPAVRRSFEEAGAWVELIDYYGQRARHS